MPAKEFWFALEVSSKPPTPDLFRDLAARVLAFAGCRPDQVANTVDALQAAALDAGEPGGLFQLEFKAAGGTVTTTLATRRQPVWRSTHLLT